MNRQLQNQEENTSSSYKNKKGFLFGVTMVAAALVGIGTSIAEITSFLNHSVYEVSEADKSSAVIAETTIPETKVLETSLSAAASVQTENADVISEIVTEHIVQTVPVTEQQITESSSENVTEPVTTQEETTVPTTETPTEAPAAVISETVVSVPETIPVTTEETTAVTVPETTVTVPEETAPAETEPSETIAETSEPEEKENYKSVLENILYHQSFQNDIFEYMNESDIYENEFAIYDVDNDGQEELIIRWSNTYMAAVVGIVYGYDSDGNIYQKLRTTPYLRFYSNGVIEADDSHNQGLSGAFWPYSLYQYDSTENIYQKAGHIDAWDESVENEYSQEIYPYEADISNSGFVYYIDSPDYDYGTGMPFPVDVTEYDFWHESYLKDAAEIHLPFRKMTEANIAQVNE